MTDERLILFPIPSLVAVLLDREREKGIPLTEEEVLAIRDGAQCVAMPTSVAAQVAEKRGYDDIDPENAWEERCAIRSQ